MIFHRCKSLIFQTFQNPLILQKTHDSGRLFVLVYSSSIEIPSNSTDAILNLLHKHEFSPKTASKVASSLSYLKDTKRCDSVLTFLKDAGFSAAQLEKFLLKKPAVLASELDNTIKHKIKIFEDLGFSRDDIADIFSADPLIFARSAENRLVPSIMALKTVLGSISDVAKALKVSGSYLKCDLDRTLLPNIEYLKSCGIRTERIMKFIYSFPRFMLHKPENMEKFVEKAEEMGGLRHSKMFIYGVRTIASMSDESWKEKLELFRDIGFSQKQILFAFQKKPQVFAVSCRKIQKLVRLILDSENYGMSDIHRCPDVFICSVEKTIEPRLRVLDVLERRNLLEKPPGFSVTYRISQQVFFDRYIKPNLGEVSEFTSLDDWRKEISKFDSIICS